MTGSLKDQTVLVIGRGSGLARAIALAAQDAGSQVIAAGRSAGALAAGTVDHVVSTASARARGRVPTWTATRSGSRSTPR